MPGSHGERYPYAMRICLYLEAAHLLARSGIYRAYTNHLRALAGTGIEVTPHPRGDYDLLHLHWFGPKSLRYMRRAKRRGIPVVIHAHSIGRYDFAGGFTGTRLLAPLYERILDRIYARADAIFAPSEFAAAMLARRGLGPVYVVSNGADLSRFRPDEERRKRWREMLGLTGFTVYSAGNVLPRKGVLDFIAVAERLPGLRFIWFGQRWGPLALYPRMEWRIRRAPGNVRFAGFVDDPAGAYDACDLFFFPTHGENQPLALLEAAALGKPLVVRDVPAFSHLEPGVHCLKGNSVEEFCRAIRAVAEDPALRGRLSRNAMAFAAEHDLRRVGARLAALYRRVLAGRRGGCPG